jgi:hypothetical protein
MNEYPCIDCGSNVRLRQEALQCDQCSQWQHRLCNTGKTFLSNFIAFVYYLTPPNYKQKIKKCRIMKALTISSVTHTNTHSIIGNATTKYEEFLWGKAINQSVLMKWKYRGFLNKHVEFHNLHNYFWKQ